MMFYGIQIIIILLALSTYLLTALKDPGIKHSISGQVEAEIG